jgi:hypothetical protein
MNRLLLAASVAALLSLPAAASATIVNIDASVSGCDGAHCAGGHVGPGTVLFTVRRTTWVAFR